MQADITFSVILMKAYDFNSLTIIGNESESVLIQNKLHPRNVKI